MIRDRGQSADSSMVMMTGDVGYDVPGDLLEGFPHSKFSLATWMRHRPREQEDKHRKEHVICQADDHRKNRHHMALFVRNCKLVLLLRREFREGEENIFRPAEWRWKMPQVCDDQWHHYALNVDFPEVTLFVDGEAWTTETAEETGKKVDNPEVIDDWPLHPAGDIKTKISIGACWQGSDSTYRHQMKGYLAGLSYSPKQNENREVLKCLHQCAESLQVPDPVTPSTKVMAPGTTMTLNARGSMATVSGDNADDMAALVKSVAYLNTREFPAPGRRIARLETRLECEDGKTIHLEPKRLDIDVIPVPEPNIEISGTEDISRDYEDFKMGVRVFADVRIVMTTGNANGNGEPVNGIENRLDQCMVSVSPALNPDHESLDVPHDLLKSLAGVVSGKVSVEGAEFSGAEMIYNYERLLRQVTYTNQKPAYYLNRQFKISCSELNGRFVSNEYLQTLTVIHPSVPDAFKEGASPEAFEEEDDKQLKGDGVADHEAKVLAPKVSHRQMDMHGVQQSGNNVYSRRSSINNNDESDKNYLLGLVTQSHNNVSTVVAVVCVGFILVFVSLGIVRFRAAQKRAARDDLQAEIEMAWDDSALNITVNPLEDSDKLGSGDVGGSMVSCSGVLEGGASGKKVATRSSLASVANVKNGTQVLSTLGRDDNYSSSEEEEDDDDEDDDDDDLNDDEYDDEDDDDLDDDMIEESDEDDDDDDDEEAGGGANAATDNRHNNHSGNRRSASNHHINNSEAGERRLEWDHDI